MSILILLLMITITLFSEGNFCIYKYTHDSYLKEALVNTHTMLSYRRVHRVREVWHLTCLAVVSVALCRILIKCLRACLPLWNEQF